MFWNDIQHLSNRDFKRLTGVTLDVFVVMVDAYQKETFASRKHPRRGVSSKLTDEDKILLMLMYYREYRTMYHIGATYKVSESTVCKIIDDVETKLIKDPRFHLPGKKALLDTNSSDDIVLIDVSESPVERPKKNSVHITLAKRKDTP